MSLSDPTETPVQGHGVTIGCVIVGTNNYGLNESAWMLRL